MIHFASPALVRGGRPGRCRRRLPQSAQGYFIPRQRPPAAPGAGAPGPRRARRPPQPRCRRRRRCRSRAAAAGVGRSRRGEPTRRRPGAAAAVPDLPPLPKGADAAGRGDRRAGRARDHARRDGRAAGREGDRRAAREAERGRAEGAGRLARPAAGAGQRARQLTPDQIRAKERELQERITNAQKSFRDRNRIIQEAAQYGSAQIERTLIAVIRQVAESRGMNLVLHRPQVALNVNEFDITDQVVEQLNKVMPTCTCRRTACSAASPAPAAPGADPRRRPRRGARHRPPAGRDWTSRMRATRRATRASSAAPGRTPGGRRGGGRRRGPTAERIAARRGAAADGGPERGELPRQPAVRRRCWRRPGRAR